VKKPVIEISTEYAHHSPIIIFDHSNQLYHQNHRSIHPLPNCSCTNFSLSVHHQSIAFQFVKKPVIENSSKHANNPFETLSHQNHISIYQHIHIIKTLTILHQQLTLSTPNLHFNLLKSLL